MLHLIGVGSIFLSVNKIGSNLHALNPICTKTGWFSVFGFLVLQIYF